MKKIINPLLATALVAGTVSAKAQSLEDRVEELETQSYLNVVKFGGMFATRYDSITRKTNSSGVEVDHNPLRIQMALDAEANISDKVQFYGRIGASKFFNTINYDESAGSLNASRDEGGTEVHLERAFINYKILSNLTFTAGRLPTVDGPPTEMYDDTARQGTYPFLAYGSQLDGFALTYSTRLAGNGFTVRGVYSPLFTLDKDTNDGLSVPKRSTAQTAPQMKEQASLYTGMVEFENTSSSFWDSFLAIGQMNKISGIQIQDTVTRGTDLGVVTGQPSAGGNGIPTATTILFEGSDLEFGLETITANFSMKNLMKTGFNFGFTYYRSKVDSEGYAENNAAIAAANATLGASLGVNKGAMTDENKAETTGSAYMAQVSYKTPVSMLNNPTVGFEYFKGEKDFVNFASNSEDITGFYQTRGKAMHAWLTMPLDMSMKWRLGYMAQKHDYSKGFLGAPTTFDVDETTLYTNLRVDF